MKNRRVRFGLLLLAALATVLLWQRRPSASLPSPASGSAGLAHQVSPPSLAPESGAADTAAAVPAPAAVPAARPRLTPAEAVATAGAFTEWLTAWRRADASTRPGLVASGLDRAIARRAALKDLIEQDPRLALELAVPAGLRADLPSGLQAQLEQPIDARGTLEVNIGCFGTVTRIERAALIGDQRYAVHTFGRRENQGTKFGLPLHGVAIDGVMALAETPYRLLDDAEKLTRGLAPTDVAVAVGGDVTVLGSPAELTRLAEDLVAAESVVGPHLAAPAPADGVPGVTVPGRAAATPWVAGEKRVLWIQVDFSDDTGAYATAAEIAATNTQVSDFYAANSQGVTTMTFTVLPGVLRLPRSKAVYNASSTTTTQLQTDAVAAAKAYDTANGGTGTYDPDRYDRRLVVFKRIPAYAFGGLANITGPAVWLNGTVSATTVAHELGHTQGLRHSHYWLPSGSSGAGPGVHVEYGDVFDNMGGGSATTGHFSSPQKSVVGYLEGDTITSITQAGTFRLNRHDHRDATGVRGLKLVAGDLGYEYWVEHRRQGPAGFNNAQLDRLRNGVLVHWGPGKAPKFTSGPGSYLVDATAGSAGGAVDAPLRINETFVDPDAGVTIKPLAVGGTAPNEYIDVQVAFGAIDGNRNPILQANAPTGNLAARTNIIFRASATDPDGDAVYYRWDFGDGQINPNLDNLTRRFTKGGTYSLRVSAHDGKGGIAARTLALNIADPLVNWTARNSGTTVGLNDVIFAGGRFLAVSTAAVVTSPDGVTWTRSDAGTTSYGWIGAAYSGTRYVVVGLRVGSTTDRGGAAYSDDGATWTLATMPAGVGQILSVTYGAGRFVGVGENGRIYFSTDGATWANATSPVTNTLRSVAFADNLFVTSGDSGRILTSPNGEIWTNRSVATGNTLGVVTRYNGNWIASSATVECFKSPDGETWTRIATNGRTSGAIRLASISGVLLGATGNGSINFTEDPQNWVTHQIDSTANTNITGVAEGNGVIVSVGSRGIVFTTASSVPGSPLIAAPVLRNDADSLKVSVGRKNVLSAGGSGFTKLELYANGTKVSEINGTAGALSWTPAAIGSYSLVVRGITATGESVVSATVPAIAGMARWTWRNPTPLGSDLNGAVKVGDKWWAVGRAGAVVTIDAAGVVTPVDFPTTQHLTAIAHANGRFVVVGPYADAGSREEIGSIWTSTDGYAWTPLLTTVFDNFVLSGVTYADEKWMVVGSGGMLQTSTDGLVWTRQVSGTTSYLHGVTYANNTWVAVGAGGRIITSPDGTRWTDRPSGTTNDLWAVTQNSGTFVAVGLNGTIVRSSDGVTWTRPTSTTTSHLIGVTAWNGVFLAVGNSGTVLSSNDGANWNTASADGKFSDLFFVGGSGSTGILTGRSGEIFVSNPSGGWRRASQGTTENRQAAIYAGGRFVVVGSPTDLVTRATIAPIATSTDGVTWTRAAANSGFLNLNAVTYGQQTYVAVGDTGRIFSSTDANTWTQRGTGTRLNAVAFGPAGFVAAGDTGVIRTSSDAETWTARTSGVTVALRGAAFGADRYVVVGDSGTVLQSADGATWTAATSGVTAALLAVGYWPGYGFIAVGNIGTMISSPDGTNWQQVETGVADNLAAIALTPIGLVAAGGNNGTLIVSLDGASWSVTTLPSGGVIRGLAASSSVIVAAGESGNVLTFETRDTTPAPVISAQPAAVATVVGGAATFTVDARNTGGAVYQWLKDGVPIVGANSPIYSIPVVTQARAGNYSVAITTATGTVVSDPAALTFAALADVGRLVNLSIRTDLTSATDEFTFGVVVGGAGTSGTKALLVRAAGPSLAAFGVPNVLDDPRLEFYSGATRIGENDNWGGADTTRVAMAQVGAFPFAAANSRDAAILLPALASGAASARILGTGRGTVLAELYDATPTAAFTGTTPRLVNVSVLKHIGGGVTAGFVIGGTTSRKVLIRAVGPTLGAAPFNVGGVVSDPQLALFSGSTQIAVNDNWGGTGLLSAAFSQVGAFALPNGSRDAALLADLLPGGYTVQVTGVGGATGVALIEVYEVP